MSEKAKIQVSALKIQMIHINSFSANKFKKIKWYFPYFHRQLNDLFEHYGVTHNESGYVECCQTKLFRYPAIIMHMARHLQPDAFKY